MLKVKYLHTPTLVIAAIVITISACVSHDLEPALQIDCNGFHTVSFSTEISPIINSNCAIVGDGGCHNGGNGPDLDWRVFANFQNHASEVKRRVALPSTNPDKMPRIGSLTEDQIALLVCWVEQGAQQN